MTYMEMLTAKKMTLIMSLPSNDMVLAKAALDAGADVLKIHINLNHHASSNHFGTLEEEKDKIAEILEIKGDVPIGIVAGQDVNAVEKVANFFLKATDVSLLSVLWKNVLLPLANMVPAERKLATMVHN